MPATEQMTESQAIRAIDGLADLSSAGRRLAETVRRWTSDHASNGKPCHCLLCTALARYDQETAR